MPAVLSARRLMDASTTEGGACGGFSIPTFDGSFVFAGGGGGTSGLGGGGWNGCIGCWTVCTTCGLSVWLGFSGETVKSLCGWDLLRNVLNRIKPPPKTTAKTTSLPL